MAVFRSTERLNLRSYKEADLDTVLDLWNEVDVQQNTATDHVVPRGPKFKETIKGWVCYHPHFIVPLCHVSYPLLFSPSIPSTIPS